MHMKRSQSPWLYLVYHVSGSTSIYTDTEKLAGREDSGDHEYALFRSRRSFQIAHGSAKINKYKYKQTVFHISLPFRTKSLSELDIRQRALNATKQKRDIMIGLSWMCLMFATQSDLDLYQPLDWFIQECDTPKSSNVQLYGLQTNNSIGHHYFILHKKLIVEFMPKISETH